MIGVLAASTRPWGPFLVGVVIGSGISVYGVLHAIHFRPPSLQQPWEYETTVETYVARYRHYDWRYSVLLGTPVVAGVLTWLVWLLLSLSAGVTP
jgi:hypothetical protein